SVCRRSTSAAQASSTSGSASRVAISRSTSLALSAGVNCKAAASSVSTVSDSNAIVLSIQTRRTILIEHHPMGSTPPCLRRSRLSVARSLQTRLLLCPALILDPMLLLFIFINSSATSVYHFDWLACSSHNGIWSALHGWNVRGGR